MCFLVPTQILAYQQFEYQSGFIITNYDRESVLPSNTVSDIHIANNGMLYAASNNGLILSDGFNWDAINVESNRGFDSNQILKIHESPDGRIFIQDQQNHLYRLSQSREAIQYTSNNGEVYVQALAFLGEDVYVLTESALHVFNDDTLIKIDTLDIVGKIWDMQFFKESLYIVSSTGVFMYAKNTFTNVLKSSNYVDARFYTQFFNTENELFIFGNGGADCLKVEMNEEECDGSSIEFSKEIELRNIHWKEGDSTAMILATNNGVLQKSGKDTQPLLEGTSSLRYESYFKIQEDHFLVGANGVWVNNEQVFTPKFEIVDAATDGKSLWLTTDQEGIFQIHKSPFSHFLGEPFTNNYALAKNNHNGIYAGSFEFGLSTINGEEVEVKHRENSELPNNTIRMMAALSDGNTLVSTWGEPPLILKNDEFEAVKAFSGIDWPITNVAEGFYEFSNGDWLVGTLDGLLYVKGGETNWLHLENGEHLKGVSRIVPIRDTNEVLLCTQFNGIFLYSSSGLYPLTQKLPDHANQVRDVFVQSKDTVWAASYNSGLHRYIRNPDNPLTFDGSFYSQAIGIEQTGLHSMLVDEAGTTWIPSNEGLISFKFDDLLDAVEKQRPIANLTVYTERDGLINREFNGGSQNVYLFDNDGSIWLSNQSGIVYFNSEELSKNSRIENGDHLYIRSIKGTHSNMEFPVSDTVQIHHRERSVEIEFAHINLFDNRTAHLWIKEEGKPWVQSESDGSYEVQSLHDKTGKIQFSTHPESEQVHTVILKREVPFYATTLFRVMILIGLAMLISHAVKVPMGWKKNQKAEEETLDDALVVAESSPAEAIETVILENFQNPIFNQNELARLLNMSKSKVYRQWSAKKKVSINDYILSRRLQKAIELLTHSNHSITEVAELSGFNSQSYFSKVFKKYYQISPSEFLKSKKG